MKIILLFIGVLMTAMGLLWIGQGLGYIQWPASSFMISQIQWTYYGSALTIAGLVILFLAQRRK